MAAAGGPEPFLGYDGLDTDGVLEWIREAEPEPDQLRPILQYEREHRRRETILDEVERRLEG